MGVTCQSNEPEHDLPFPVSPALVGKAGEVLVAGELLRQGIEVAYPATDRGIDLLAYRLDGRHVMARNFVPIQVKSRATSGFYFHRSWFTKVPGIVLVHVWNVTSNPELYVFASLDDVEKALGNYAQSPSWKTHGIYNVTEAKESHMERMKPFRNKWSTILDRIR